MKLIEWMARNPVAANLLMFVCLIGGFVNMNSIKQEVFPEFELDIINIVIPYSGATPADIEESILIPVEEALDSIVDIKSIRAYAYEGAGRFRIELEEGSDNPRVLDDVKAVVSNVTSLPEDSETPVINMIRIRREVVQLVLYGNISEQALSDLADNVKNDLLSKEKITQVDVIGIRDHEISIEIPQAQLQRFGLTMQEVANTIRASTLDLPGGTLKTSSGDVLIRTKERRYTAAEYARIPILSTEDGEVLLEDIGTVRDSFEEVDTVSSYNGKPSILIEIYRVGNQTPTEISETVRASLADIKDRFPPGVELEIMDDRSLALKDRINLLVKNAALGLTLVLLLLAIFLESKLAFWISMGIPISFMGAFLFMPAADTSINMISLFAFILVLGIVVDDAIVVGENIYAHQEMGKSKLRASVEGTLEIGGPVLFAILTTIVAFMPFFFISGTMGKFLKAIPIIVVIVLVVSLLECLYILPAHLAHSNKFKKHKGFLGRLERFKAYPSLGLEKITHGPYRKLLNLAIEYRYTTLAIGVFMLIVGGGAVAAGHLKYTFMQRIEGDRVIASVTMPFGTPLHITRQAQEKIVKEGQTLIAEYDLQQGHPTSRGIFSTLGGHGGRGNRGTHLTNARVFLQPLDVRGFSAREFAMKWRMRVGGIPGAEALTVRFSMGPGAGSDLNVRFVHPDYNTLTSAAERLKNTLAQYPGVSDIEDSDAEGKPEIQIQLRPEGNAIGMTTLGLTQQVRSAFQGTEVLSLQRGSDEVKVMLRYPREERRYRQNLDEMVVKTPSGGEILLSEVAYLNFGHSYSQINREDGKRILDITAKVDHTIANTREIEANLNNEVLPELANDYPALEYSFAGRNRSRATSLGSLNQGAIFALFGIFCLLALQFRSYFQPLVVMSAIPFGVIGAFLGHWIMGYQLSLVSLLGIVALSGIVVNDSLILVDFINNARRRGATLREAILQGGTRRFRPILLTSLTTFFGLLPMITETSLQARFLIPMAISLGFGVMVATFITLLLIPCLYFILEDILAPFRKLFPQTEPALLETKDVSKTS